MKHTARRAVIASLVSVLAAALLYWFCARRYETRGVNFLWRDLFHVFQISG